MRWTLRLAAVIAALGAFPFVTGSSAEAWEYCRRDVTGHMLGCSFSGLEQCEATCYGIGGDCLRDPFLPDAHNSSAYKPMDPGTVRNRPVELNARRTAARIGKGANPARHQKHLHHGAF
jgi:hypothetical protein